MFDIIATFMNNHIQYNLMILDTLMIGSSKKDMVVIILESILYYDKLLQNMLCVGLTRSEDFNKKAVLDILCCYKNCNFKFAN